MKKHVILVLISIVSFFTFGKVCAQEKITLEMTSVSAEFDGHDAALLFKNLNALLRQNKAKGKLAAAESEFLKGKPIYKNLTTDDYFAFTLKRADYVTGRNRETKLSYTAALFPLLGMEDFPAPEPKYLELSSGIGMSSPISSPQDLISEFVADVPLEDFWKSYYLPVKTVYPRMALAKKYKGKKAVCSPLSGSTDAQICDGLDFIVPSPQIHYGIAFVKPQAYPLVRVSRETLSLKTYKFEYKKGAGLAAWLENGEKYGGYNNVPLFIVKLAAPYLETKNFQMQDAIEQKPHQAARNVLFVELAAIWIYDQSTRQIVSKSGEKFN